MAVPERNWVNIQWLARLRWAEIAGQAMTVLVGQFLLDGALPMAQLFAVIAIGLVTNLAIELYFFGDRRRGSAQPVAVHEWQLALVMATDIAILTGLLYLTGGPLNPFGFLYLVQIALAAMVVRARWTWGLVALSFAGLGVLAFAHQPLHINEQSRAIGVWVAVGVASAFVVYFLMRVNADLALRDAELAEAKNLAARQERLASLATMTAGAAHELSTPLGTVALTAKELERALKDHPELAADARLIREQVGRCRAILEQMQQGAGTIGENISACTVAQLLDEAMLAARTTTTVHREISDEVAATRLVMPPRAVSQALRSLITNAQDASPANATVIVAVRRDGDALAISIRDRGAGIPAEVMARMGEPFFTTKAPGRGMGLGLFLARAVIEGVGGSLRIAAHEAGGTEVTIALPIDAAKPDPRASTPAIVASNALGAS